MQTGIDDSVSDEYRKLLCAKRQKLQCIVDENLPGKFSIAEACLSVKAASIIDGMTLPIMLVLLGPPSSGKSTIIRMIEALGESYSTDSFTPKSFVSHAANRTDEELAKIDLLNQIKNKTFLTSDLAPTFSVRDDVLIENIGILTRVLDGQGFKKNSGVHGQRGYSEIFFVWIGAMVDVPKNIWPLIARLGAKQFFLRIDVSSSFEEEKQRIIANMKGKSYEQKLVEMNKEFQELWNTIKSFPVQKDGKIIWNSAKDEEKAWFKIVERAQLLARLRGHVPTDNTEGTSGSNYGFLSPIIEDPERATHSLYNIVRGYALTQGRNYIIESDVVVIESIVLSSASKERIELLKLLIENNGELTTTQFVEMRKVSKSTALRTMKQLEILGIVDETTIPTKTKPVMAIRLKKEFGWLLKSSQKE